MDKYLIERSLSDNDVLIFDKIVEKFSSVKGALFGGYPFFLIGNQSNTCRGLIIVNNGIFVLTRNDNEFLPNMMHLIQTIYNDISIAKMLPDDKNEYIHEIKLNEINDELDAENIINRYKKIFDDAQIDKIISLIQKTYILIRQDNRIVKKKNSIGSKIVDRSKKVAVLDEDQFSTIYSEYKQHMRVRGLAGSGKTILLAKKMAYIHFKEPEKELAYIFYTKSLKQTIQKFFKLFYEEYEKYGDIPNMDKIHILYCWGGKASPGLISKVADALEIDNPLFSPLNDVEKTCGKLINHIINNEKNEEVRMFDYIFIDEAQDFRINFFKLAKMTLKPFGYITYAYDELQTLIKQDSIMPSKEEILDGENCKDENLRKCYRTPTEILVTAHALGLGVYHKKEFVNVIEDKEIWGATGYIIKSGSLKGGQNVSLYREKIIDNYNIDTIITKKIHENKEYNDVVNEIVNLVKNEDVNPEDILIIDLDSNFNSNYTMFMSALQEKAIDNKRPFEVNLINKDQGFIFTRPGYVSYTTIFRAKGNEANIVFVINSTKDSVLLGLNRNRIFTAMTRAKFQVYLYGDGDEFDELLYEIDKVKENNYCLNFRYPKKDEIAKYKNKIYLETRTQSKFEEVSKDENVDKLALLKMMMEDMTPEEKKALIETLKKE